MRRTIACAYRLPISVTRRFEQLWQARCEQAAAQGLPTPTKTSLVAQALERLCDDDQKPNHRRRQS